MKKIFAKFIFFTNYIVPVVLIAGIIFYLSSQAGLGDIKNNMLELFLRKGAHFIEYGLLSFFVWRLFYYGRQFHLVSSFWLSLILVLLYAISDERHQFFVEGRSGKSIDVVIDFLSAYIILQIVVFWISKNKRYLIGLLIGVLAFSGVLSWMAWDTAMKSPKNLKLTQSIVKNYKQTNGKEYQESQNNAEGHLREKKNEDYELNQKKRKLNQKKEQLVEPKDKQEKVILPKKVSYKVSFTTQSPFAKWDQLHEEACEEASLIMLKYFYDKKELNKSIAEKEIQKLVKYQNEQYGDFYDTDIRTNGEIAEKYFEIKGLKILTDFTVTDLKRELAQGGIILVPTAGQELYNPNFKAPGPLYHNLVIIGYDDEAIVDSAGHSARGVFITNDPGTRKGKNYKYDQQVLYEAIHDFPGDVNKILKGKKRALVLMGQKIEN